jgi:hypothetical protein
MNERIKQILLQVVPMAGEDGEYLPSLHTPEDIEQFAQLIVEECINCTKEWRDAVRVGSDRDYSRGYVHGCDDAIVEMKTRFGVSE